MVVFMSLAPSIKKSMQNKKEHPVHVCVCFCHVCFSFIVVPLTSLEAPAP